MKSIKNCKLYLILDAEVVSYKELLSVARRSLKAGVGIIQIRDKKASARDLINFFFSLKRIVKNRVPIIINDRLDVAWVCRADGVHLGQEDIPVRKARRILGSSFLIGCSCQNMAAVKRAQHDSADYIGFGSVFRTLTKPERKPMNLKLLSKVVQQATIPVFGIGGIGLNNIHLVIDHGCNRVAVCRALCRSKKVTQKTRSLINLLSNARVIQR